MGCCICSHCCSHSFKPPNQARDQALSSHAVAEGSTGSLPALPPDRWRPGVSCSLPIFVSAACMQRHVCLCCCCHWLAPAAPPAVGGVGGPKGFLPCPIVSNLHPTGHMQCAAVSVGSPPPRVTGGVLLPLGCIPASAARRWPHCCCAHSAHCADVYVPCRRDYYDLLQVPRGASEAQIKRAYRKVGQRAGGQH